MTTPAVGALAPAPVRSPSSHATLYAISDLHIARPANRRVLECLRPPSADDWLIVAGDLGESAAELEHGLRLLTARFNTVIWAPGNHELWTPRTDPGALKGEALYHHLVSVCRSRSVLTPEDPFPVWTGRGGPATIAPLFVLYDYSFGTSIAPTKEQALASAYDHGVVCSDEFLLHPDPYPSREAWCHARVLVSEERLRSRDPALPTILVNHFPLIREPTFHLARPHFAQWCGTTRTADWHRRFGAGAVVYGHLHIPRSHIHDGVRFEEVSLRPVPHLGFEQTARTSLRAIVPARTASPSMA